MIREIDDSEKDEYEDIVNHSSTFNLALQSEPMTDQSKGKEQSSLTFDNSSILSGGKLTKKSSTSHGEPRILNKVNRQKFDFIFKRSVFRHMCAFFKMKFVQFTDHKKVHQNKLIEKTREFVDIEF